MVDMRANLAMGITIALAGAVLVRSMKPPSSATARHLWLPAIAFVAGPLLTVGWVVLDIYCVSEFTHPDDVRPLIVAATFIGVVAGTIGAAVFWFVERFR